MLQINVGHGSTAAPDTVPIAVSPGETVNISNISDDTSVYYFLDGLNDDSSELVPGDNADFTAPTWLQVTGDVGEVVVSGGQYGDAQPDQPPPVAVTPPDDGSDGG